MDYCWLNYSLEVNLDEAVETVSSLGVTLIEFHQGNQSGKSVDGDIGKLGSLLSKKLLTPSFTSSAANRYPSTFDSFRCASYN